MRLIDADKLYKYIDDEIYTTDKYAEVEDILDIIAEFAEETPNKWIPVGESLPKMAFGCLVTVEEDDRNGEPQSVLYHEFVGYDGETWNNADGEPIPFEVIAWMPLPKSYKAESEDKK